MANQQSQKASSGNKRNAQAPSQSRKGASPGTSSASTDDGAAERDETYGLISVLYHALQGAETYTQYIADAERAGANDLLKFFQECQAQENERAMRAKQLLARQLEDTIDEDEDEDEDDDEE
jgi:hypothetical protein